MASRAPARYSSVDVFLTSAGEDLRVVDNTFTHVADLNSHGPGDLGGSPSLVPVDGSRELMEVTMVCAVVTSVVR